MIKNPWKENRLLREELHYQSKMKNTWLDIAAKRDDALRRIAAEERPTSNATVKRMAKIAREALEL